MGGSVGAAFAGSPTGQHGAIGFAQSRRRLVGKGEQRKVNKEWSPMTKNRPFPVRYQMKEKRLGTDRFSKNGPSAISIQLVFDSDIMPVLKEYNLLSNWP